MLTTKRPIQAKVVEELSTRDVNEEMEVSVTRGASDSATESESDHENAAPRPESPMTVDDPKQKAGPSTTASPSPRHTPFAKAPLSEDDSSSSPLRPPAKKLKSKQPSSDEDSDSETERKKQIAKLKSGGGAARGPRQPLKRGGKRF